MKILREKDLRSIIKESVKRILIEHDYDEYYEDTEEEQDNIGIDVDELSPSVIEESLSSFLKENGIDKLYFIISYVIRKGMESSSYDVPDDYDTVDIFDIRLDDDSEEQIYQECNNKAKKIIDILDNACQKSKSLKEILENNI